MGWLREMLRERRARREGAHFLSTETQRAFREVAGPAGYLSSSKGYDEVAKAGAGYLDSFDPRIPPSLHVSERDRTRFDRPIPLVERCIEDWPSTPVADDPDGS